MEELGVTGRHEREHTEEDRDGQTARSKPPTGLGEHRLDLLDRVERLGHHQVRPGLELALEPLPFGRRIGRRRVEGAGDRETGPLADRRAGPILGQVEPGEDLDQPDRIDIPHTGRRRVVADARWIAGQGDDVADAEGVGAQQL